MKKKFAICGLGRIAERFFSVASTIEDIEIVAVASSDKLRAAEWAIRHNIDPNRAYHYDELYLARDVDAVYVATNNHLHCTNVVNLLNNKKAVLCEKPLCLNIDEANKIVQTAKDNNTLLMEAMWTSFLPCTIAARDIIASGELGNILEVNAEFLTSMTANPKHRIFYKEVGGGALLDLGVYTISWIYASFGRPNSIVASATLQNGIDLTTDIVFKYDKFNATMKCSCVHAHKQTSIRVVGNKATLLVNDFQGAKQLQLITINTNASNNNTININASDNNANNINASDNNTSVRQFEYKDGFYYEIKHFVDLLNNQSIESSLQTHDKTLAVMQLITQIQQQIGVSF